MAFLPHKKFTWTDFGRVYIPHIPPVATPLQLLSLLLSHPRLIDLDIALMCYFGHVERLC